MESMKNIKKELKNEDLAATATVNFDEMVRIAGDWLRAGKVKDKPHPVTARDVR
jgi:hypothetical protein